MKAIQVNIDSIVVVYPLCVKNENGDIINLQKSKASADHLIQRVVSFLDDVIQIRTRHFVGFEGYFKNLRVRISRNRITVIGSLAKFFYDNNYNGMSLEHIPRALEELAILGIPIERGILRRIDVGVNIHTDEQPVNYLDVLEETPGWQRQRVRLNQVIFIKGSHSLTFYNKAKELRRSDRDLYDILSDNNIIRIENRLTKDIHQILGYQKPIRLTLLRSETFRRKLIAKFIEHYQEIVKTKNFRFLNGKNVADVKNATYFLGIEYVGGINKYISMVKELKKQNHWNGDNKLTAVRKWIRERVMTNNPCVQETTHAKELDEKLAIAFSELNWFQLPIFGNSDQQN